MADEFDPANENIKQTRFWVEHLPVNDAYVALFGDKLETASRIPLRHPEIPALGKKRNVATPLEQQYGHKRWEQLPKEQTLFSTLEEIDTTLEKSGLWRDPETNDIVSIENRPRPKDQPRLPPLLEGPPEEPGKKPSKGRVMRGIGSLMRGRNVFSLIQALREGYELLPEEYQVLDEALQYLKGTQFSIDKPGIESFKELLGISPEDLGETIPLPGREPSQRTSSKDTSIKQIAAVFKKPEIFDLKEGSVNLDIGGGKFDLGTDYLRNERGVENLVFDKFNRSPEHNEEVLNRIRGTGGADSATAANVLNVIEEPEARERVIQQSYDYTKDGGKVFFQVYEGSGTGVGRETTKGWQNNKKTLEYIPEIEGIFGEGNVQRKGDIIIALKDRMSRAHKLGFTVDAYHYTAAPEDFEEFLAGGPDYEKASGRSALETGIQLSGPGVWFSSSPEDLESGAGWKGYRDVGHKKEGGRVIPARLRIEEPLYLDLFNQEEMADRWVEAAAGKPESLSWYKQEFPMILNQPTVDKLRAAGFDTIIDEGSGAGFDHKGGPEYIVLDTRNIRARSAKFDPEESKSADMSKAAGGFIDKPLYDDRRMIG